MTDERLKALWSAFLDAVAAHAGEPLPNQFEERFALHRALGQDCFSAWTAAGYIPRWSCAS
jgi:hypothetical protein